jgi:hypothetical protein
MKEPAADRPKARAETASQRTDNCKSEQSGGKLLRGVATPLPIGENGEPLLVDCFPIDRQRFGVGHFNRLETEAAKGADRLAGRSGQFTFHLGLGHGVKLLAGKRKKPLGDGAHGGWKSCVSIERIKAPVYWDR